MSPALDYKSGTLYINGIVVNALTVVGVLVELMFQISSRQCINFPAFEERDLPDWVLLNLDGHRGEKKVLCYDADRALAIRLGKLIRVKLSSCNLEVKLVCVDVKVRGKKEGEHDLICEVVGGPGSDQVRQYLSVEIKLRMLYSDAGLAKVRREQQKELCNNLKWWPAQKDKFCGRLIVLG